MALAVHTPHVAQLANRMTATRNPAQTRPSPDSIIYAFSLWHQSQVLRENVYHSFSEPVGLLESI